ncbi:MAG: patatin-like phospholipase family protein [Candidatus Syntrophosphaera sp.]|nr:patatin-like phospholipase family protein [Candidatus Syntrophosphaera sp.]
MKKEAKLILGGGAAYGLAHIGVLEAIAEEYTVTGIVGTSMGAIVGGLYAQGKTPREILELALDSRSALIFNPLVVPALPKILSTNLLSGLHSQRTVLGLFNKWTGKALIEELPIPFVAVAFDLKQSKTVLIDKGRLADAMRASSSLPLVFPPHRMGKYLFIDGGIEHPLPLAFQSSVPGDITIAVNVLPRVSTHAEKIVLGGEGDKERLWPHQVVIQSVLQNQGYVAIQAMLQNPPDLFIDAHDPDKKMFDLFEARDFYQYGYKAARASLEHFSEPSFMEHLIKGYQGLISRFGRNEKNPHHEQ